MADIVDRRTRSKMMAGIRGADTKPEMLVRKGLHKVGFRYRLHDKSLPGRPDLVLPRYKAVIFINGCFWHGHNCALFKWPSSRQRFWEQKIRSNVARDWRNLTLCAEAGWRVLVIWECTLKGPTKIGAEATVIATSRWLNSRSTFGDVSGKGGLTAARISATTVGDMARKGYRRAG